VGDIRLDEENHNFTPGTILKVGKDGLVVACGVGKVVIKEVQFDSSRRMTVEEYICGHKVGEGEVLGQ